MVTWILTIGSSDIQLKTQETWLSLYDKFFNQLYDHLFEPVPIEDKNLWTVPARALGIAYGQDLDTYYDDFHFPLVDSFCECLNENNIIPDQIIFLCSDQSNLFDEISRSSINCPYWKDTCTLEPILTKYLQDKFPKSQLTPLTLRPAANSEGLDSWDSTLTLVQSVLLKLNCEKEKVIYVSHQAGTPAISSALQFASLAKFGDKVKFLVTNEYDQEKTEILDSSRYLRGIQIEQAKSLVKNSPGAAKKLIEGISDINRESVEKLNYFVDFFNLNRSFNDREDEFSIEAATQRIVDCLDLIAIFLSQENYLQAISLISAAQETFMKVAILQKISDITVVVNDKSFKGSQALQWNNEGLSLSDIVIKNNSIEEQEEILDQLSFPVNKYPLKPNEKFKKINQNSPMLEWLQNLEPKFHPWELLKWSCKYYRNRENDLRNRLMHNLRGVEKQEVVKYLSGYKPIDNNDIIKAYNGQVKDPFFKAINILSLPYKKEKLINELNKFAESLS
jgi:hypothetical protein